MIIGLFWGLEEAHILGNNKYLNLVHLTCGYNNG